MRSRIGFIWLKIGHSDTFANTEMKVWVLLKDGMILYQLSDYQFKDKTTVNEDMNI
jgi:hypothetical protein